MQHQCGEDNQHHHNAIDNNGAVRVVVGAEPKKQLFTHEVAFPFWSKFDLTALVVA